ncbi:MAG: peptide chain release factor aRF-1 [Candidatus Atabeyarchaeum deiterrae]
MPKYDSFEKFKLERELEALSNKHGFHTELISLYVPPGKQLSEVTNNLKQEYGTSTNIKSKSTRQHVLDAITTITQRLKMMKTVPENGLAIFCGAIPQNGQGTEKMELYPIVPLEPVNIYIYRCDNKFYIDPLKDMLKETETYGIIMVDRSEAALASLRGKHLDVVKRLTSGVPSKHTAGGQSQRRFERLIEQAVHEFFKRVGGHADEIFLNVPDLKGILIGGAGPTKERFAQGGFMNYQLQQKVLSLVDTGNSGEDGIEELIENSSELLKGVRYTEEKKLVQRFLELLAKDTGLAAYGEKEVRELLNQSTVDTLLLSEALDTVRVTVSCASCGYKREETIRQSNLSSFQQTAQSSTCPKCNSPLAVTETKPILDDLAELAEKTNAKVEVISTETEEGQELKQGFGGVAATLRYRPANL